MNACIFIVKLELNTWVHFHMTNGNCGAFGLSLTDGRDEELNNCEKVPAA